MKAAPFDYFRAAAGYRSRVAGVMARRAIAQARDAARKAIA